MPRHDIPDLPVPAGEPAPGRTRTSRRQVAAGAAVVEAQQETRRGLKGGRDALDRARRAYLETQWSGEDDRRPEPGLLTRARL